MNTAHRLARLTLRALDFAASGGLLIGAALLAVGLILLSTLVGCGSYSRIDPAHTAADRVTTTTGPSHKRTVTIWAPPPPPAGNPCGAAKAVRP